jgi:para-aminobenzoate synthetase component I
MGLKFENCVFVPAGDQLPGTIYVLENKPDVYSKNSFVLIPYQNPQSGIVKPLFYKLAGAVREDAIAIPTIYLNGDSIRLKARTSKEEYIEKVKQLKEQIQNGNIYEINYCMEFYAENVSIDPLAVFLSLHRRAKAPYSHLLKIGSQYIICCSPELFLKKEGTILLTKPIKGTIRRGKDFNEDEHLKNTLQNSLKERTENVMAVDVARNDLSQLAKKGTVNVNKLYNIETFETLHQMVSNVSCELKEGLSFDQIIKATFPMASMTGAPKLRAMQLIEQYEDFERNCYSGTMGMIDENENYTLAVIIRSIFYNEKSRHLNMAVGSAITYLSDPEKEYEECLLKAKGMMEALGASITD